MTSLIVDDPVSITLVANNGSRLIEEAPEVAALRTVTRSTMFGASTASENSSRSAPSSRLRTTLTSEGATTSASKSEACSASVDGTGMTELLPVSLMPPSLMNKKVLFNSFASIVCILMPFMSASVKFTMRAVFGVPRVTSPPVREYVCTDEAELFC